MAAPTYDLLLDYGAGEGEAVSSSPHWVLAVVRLGEPISFDRSKGASFSVDPVDGVRPREGSKNTLVIASDCISLTVERHKRSHVKNLSAALKRSDGIDYLKEVQPGDWLLAWMVNNEADFLSLLDRINKGEPCNGAKDGLKFVGRVHQIRKQLLVDADSGQRHLTYTLQGMGMAELDTQIFYDFAVGTLDVLKQNVGQWLARIGVDADAFFDPKSKDPIDGNVNKMIPRIIDLIVGTGVSGETSNPAVAQGIAAVHGGGTEKGAPNAYLVPRAVGDLLGKDSSRGYLSYAEVLEVQQGVQTYADKKNDLSAFAPSNLDNDKSTPQRRVTRAPMLGTFYPFFPTLVNKPLWGVLQQYLNPSINELFSCMRVNPEGSVVPTVVMRQIPFTTDAFVVDAETDQEGVRHVTRFLNLPRWRLPAQLVLSEDLGRSDATRINFVHVYGVGKEYAFSNSITNQIAQHPPIRDDLDIQRSGLRSYMSTVDCAVDDTHDRTPGKWMRLIADWSMGSHLTLNGRVEAFGIQAPISEGDNLQLDRVVYHIEGLTDTCVQDIASGKRRWRTVIDLSNGLEPISSKMAPVYPNVVSGRDSTGAADPGISSDERAAHRRRENERKREESE
jgi:hypothetical protein